MAKMSAYKAHEARMWLKEILIPVVGFTAGYVLSDDERRTRIKNTLINTKDKIVEKVKR